MSFYQHSPSIDPGRDIADLLAHHGIDMADTSLGQHYTTCPRCSSDRKRCNQTKKVLGIKIDDRGVCWHCNHCEWSGPEKGMARDNIECTYDYTDEHGELLFQSVRKIPKDFYQRRPDGNGGWIRNLQGTRRVLYRLPEVIEALANKQTIHIAEGEKDVDNLWSIGLAATCNPMGAGKWRDDYNELFRDADVVIIPDNDRSGEDHLKDIVRHLRHFAARLRVVCIPDSVKDISDWLAAGHAREELEALIAAAPTVDRQPAEPKEEEPEQGGASPDLEETPWPTLHPSALHGPVGDIVRTIEPHTESDPVAILLQTLTYFGNVIGKGPFYQVEGDRHHTNLFIVLVGESSKARKGTSAGRVTQVIEIADREWVQLRRLSGLSSGEGLIWAVRDPIYKVAKDGSEECTDPGVNDKRLLADEREFAQALTVMQREGNTLSRVMRDCWDGTSVIASLTKNSPGKATGAHISVTGHITETELRRLLDRTSMSNGWANRFLFSCVKRSKCLPHGGNLNPGDIQGLGMRLAKAIEYARHVKRVTMNPAASSDWEHVYGDLSEGLPGLLGAICGRAEAQVIRLATIYALLDGKAVIAPEHIAAGIAVWEYAEASARHIFGDTLGDPVADDILRVLRNAGRHGKTRNELRELFNRHRSSSEIGSALAMLEAAGKIESKTEKRGAFRPTEIWFAKREGK
jgi:hypothetical protein